MVSKTGTRSTLLSHGKQDRNPINAAYLEPINKKKHFAFLATRYFVPALSIKDGLG